MHKVQPITPEELRRIRHLTAEELASELRNAKYLLLAIARPDETTTYDRTRRLLLEQRRALELEYIRRKRISAFRRRNLAKFSCCTYIDINRFVTKSERLATLLEVNPVEARRILRLRLSRALDRSLLEHSPLAMREVGGDAWLVIFSDVESALVWARDVVAEAETDFVCVTAAMDWGIPHLTKSGAIDDASITAIKIVENYGAKDSLVLLTERVRLNLRDQHLANLCSTFDTFDAGVLGKVSIHRVQDQRRTIFLDLADSRKQTTIHSREQLLPDFSKHVKVDLESLPTFF